MLKKELSCDNKCCLNKLGSFERVNFKCKKMEIVYQVMLSLKSDISRFGTNMIRPHRFVPV
jgi:hypothetical protein